MADTKKIVEGSYLIALSIIFTRFLSIKLAFMGVDGVRIGFGTLPIVIAGLRYGMWQGAKVGALSDILGYMLSPGGAYMPHFTVTTALHGVLPPLLVGTKPDFSAVRLFAAIAVSQLIISVFIVPYLLFALFGIPFELIVLPRLISYVLNVVLIYMVTAVLHRRFPYFFRKPAIADSKGQVC